MTQRFSVVDLQVDQDNPRFPSTASQRDAIRALLDDERPKLLNLARDIADENAVNPLDNIGVVVIDGAPVVVEGNRRVAALKLLRNPQLAYEAADVKALKEYAKKGKGPNELECHVAPTREEWRHWIELRHTGENDGVGIKPWSPEQANRYRRRRGSQADKASRFCDAVLREFPDDDELDADVQKARRERLTTIGRLVADPHIAHAFGFRFTDDDVLFDFESDLLLDGFKYIFRGMSGNSADPAESSVTSIKNKGHRQDYITRAHAVLPDPAARLATPRLPGGSSSAGGSKGGSRNKKNNGKPTTPPRPEDHIFQGLKLPNFDSRVQQVLRSSQKLRIDDATPVCAVMLRVILEMAVTEAGVDGGWAKESDTFATKLRAALLQLDPNCDKPRKRDKKYEAAWTSSQSPTGGGGIGVEQLHSYVHNFMAHPLPSELRTHSLNFRPLLEGLEGLMAAP